MISDDLYMKFKTATGLDDSELIEELKSLKCDPDEAYNFYLRFGRFPNDAESKLISIFSLYRCQTIFDKRQAEKIKVMITPMSHDRSAYTRHIVSHSIRKESPFIVPLSPSALAAVQIYNGLPMKTDLFKGKLPEFFNFNNELIKQNNMDTTKCIGCEKEFTDDQLDEFFNDEPTCKGCAEKFRKEFKAEGVKHLDEYLEARGLKEDFNIFCQAKMNRMTEEEICDNNENIDEPYVRWNLFDLLKSKADSFDGIFADHLAWVIKDLPLTTSAGGLIHARKELDEIEYDILTGAPTEQKAVEFADVIFCELDAARNEKVTLDLLKKSMREKLEINKGRDWKYNGDGSYSHIKK